MGELLRSREDLDDTYVDIVLDDLELDDSNEYYASYELVRELEAVATMEFVRVRDTTHDHVLTKRYPRPSLDLDTEPVPLYSAPYERIDILPLVASSSILERLDLRPPPAFAIGTSETPIVPPVSSELGSSASTEIGSTTSELELVDLSDLSDPIDTSASGSELERIDIASLPTGETTLDGEQRIVPVYFTAYIDDLDEAFTVGPSALPIPLYSVPYERVDLEVGSQPFVKPVASDWSFESTEIVAPPRTASRVIATIVVLVGATLLGLTIALYA
ncbi:MAG: hypothetical protein ABI591_03585 [Kofleriaceae bacterium]